VAESDIWSEWLLKRRTGGDSEMRARVLESLRPIRDRVIDGANIQPGDTVLDVGCGDGLLAFGILERHPDVFVIFADISRPLLEVCKDTARAAGVIGRCTFVECSAEDLLPIADSSVDAVVLRSVLIYVADKARAHAAFYRVLKPGGRTSYFEPVGVRAPVRTEDSFWGYPTGPVAHLAAKVAAVFAAIQGPDDPMENFTEWDLVEHARAAGFDDVRLDLQLRAGRTLPRAYRLSWEQWLVQAGNPRIPSVGDAIRQALTSAEQQQFEAQMRPLVEAGIGDYRSAQAFLRAEKSAVTAR
jgi:SAM-dependent methyltransferase